MKKKILVLFFVILLFVCCGQESRLETALRLAGENAPQLQKVLDYYSADTSGGLKYKAAVFLIENMPAHISVDSAKMHELYDSVNKLLDARYKMKNNRDSIIAFVQSMKYSKDMVAPDIKIVKGDFLIRNIDSAFMNWEKPWAKHLTFEEFCEYLLPYKYAEFQRLDNWRDSLSAKFSYAVNDVAENDMTYQYPYKMGFALNEAFATKMKPVIIFRENKLGPISPFFNSGAVHRISFGDCNDYAVVNVAMMRSLGVPAVLEYVPQWGEMASGRHGWSTICNISNFVPIPHTDKDVGDVFFPDRKLPKVFRYQYAPVPERAEFVKNTKYVHNYFALFEKDVTSEYVETSDIFIPVDVKGLIDKYAYIAVSNLRSWDIVDFGVIKRGKAHFKNMGMRDIVYLVYGFDGKKLKAISEPFILHSTGKITYFNADTTKMLDSVEIWRKYPRGENTAKMEQRMIGGKIQAANDSLFTVDSITLYEIKDMRFPDMIPLAADTTYRYWRYLGIPGSYASIAELQFYSNGVDSVLTGQPIGAAGSDHSLAFDGDWLTHYTSTNKVSPAWVGLDFGERVRVDSVRCVPRSDDNGIHVGDTYELSYFANGTWQPIKKITAEERFLMFDSIPCNSLLLLSNQTQGKQERIFTLENGRQKWW